MKPTLMTLRNTLVLRKQELNRVERSLQDAGRPSQIHKAQAELPKARLKAKRALNRYRNALEDCRYGPNAKLNNESAESVWERITDLGL